MFLVFKLMFFFEGITGCSGRTSALHSDIKSAYLESAGLIVHLGLRRLGWGCSCSRSTVATAVFSETKIFE